MRFQSWYFLALFLVFIPIFFARLRLFRRLKIPFSSLSLIGSISDRRSQILSITKIVIRVLILSILIIALARPQKIDNKRNLLSEGIDIVLALDVSGSMRAEDFKPNNRLTVAKQKTQQFIQGRESDRMGLVVFGSDAYTQCPLTLDYMVLSKFVDDMTIGMAGDGTAIGVAIATALNRLADSKSKSKVIILMTDGVNNRGEIEPLTAANLAKEMGVKVYSIGIGKEGGAPIPIDDPIYGRRYLRNPDGSLYKTEIDEYTLRKISEQTNGEYFRAFNEDDLKKIYTQIDKLEKTEVKVQKYYLYHDYFPFLIYLAVLLIILEQLLFPLFWRPI